ncbi:anti-sigma factor [Pelagibius sp.]|uniref:anti-sigma factor family protein n=1 Tax=Pelagibius sp. TaxID=1931238 RepID=UPI002611B993|nr:hypothetical protein [Pelagibius sp.]
MKTAQPTWEDLNAYVDGELPDERAAEVAAALGRDPQLAEQVAALHRMKGSVGRLVTDAPVDLPRVEARRPSWLRGGLALAASLALVTLIGSLWMFLAAPPPAYAVWAERALTSHRAWPAGPQASAGEAQRLQLAAQRELGPAAFVPDLRAAGLTLSHLGAGPRADGRESLHLGYRGARGCRLSLFLLSGGLGLEEALQDLGSLDSGVGDSDARGHQPGAHEAVAWQANGLSVLLLAEGMDPSRFAEVSRRIFEASFQRKAFDSEVRQALRQNHQDSARCLV